MALTRKKVADTETKPATTSAKKTVAKKTTTTKPTTAKTAKDSVSKPKQETKASTAKPKIGEELTATEQQILTAQSIAQLQASVNASGILQTLERIDELKKELVESFHGTEIQTLDIVLDDGSVFKISKPSSSSTVDREKVLEYLGDENFMKLATVSVTDAKKYLTPEQQSEAITTTSGKRKLTIQYPES